MRNIQEWRVRVLNIGSSMLEWECSLDDHSLDKNPQQ